MNDAIRIENIQAAYGKKVILRGVSFTVDRGEIVALIGPNGAGKSTLFKVISGFLKQHNGHVWFDNVEISALLPHERVKIGLAYQMQGGKVFPSLTVAENLEMGSLGMDKGTMNGRNDLILGIFSNLKPFLKKRAGLLSGGERQALSIAMLLSRQPQLLLLDEPSAGLSPIFVQRLMENINEINKSFHTTILIVEQNVREALNIADRTLIMTNGQLSFVTDDSKALITDGQLDQFFWGCRKGELSL